MDVVLEGGEWTGEVVVRKSVSWSEPKQRVSMVKTD